MKPPTFFYRLTAHEHRSLSLPPILAALPLFLAILVPDLLKAENPFVFTIRFGFLAIGSLYILLLFIILPTHFTKHRWLYWITAVTQGACIAVIPLVAPSISYPLWVVLIAVATTASATLSGRWSTYLFTAVLLATSLLVIGSEINRVVAIPFWVLGLLALTLMITETILRLGKIIDHQVRRVEAINRVAHIISSSIELPQVIALLNAALHDALEADTHLLGTIQGEKIRLEWFYDDGEFFPPIELPLEGSLSGWVIRNKQSILLRDVTKEGSRYGFDGRTIGKTKPSLSWIGTPLEAGGHTLGVMALGSYRKNAFHYEDLELLENIARQAALVIDNAYHHAEVEEQSRRDSLTQAYNHGYFLVALDQSAQSCQKTGEIFSLIIMDVDRFKSYNDTYGHQAGDLALVQVVESIRHNIRGSDILGRWGGEEFALILPEANGAQAYHVSTRISQTLASTFVVDTHGKRIPTPTISQGIAVFPTENEDVQKIIYLADQRLYIAKARGRNQIEPGPSFWQEQAAGP